jgi:hypothetical protein
MTGDLLFYSMILGKESMAGAWCWRCMLAKAEWQNLLHSGEPWTHEKLAAHLEKVKQMTNPRPIDVRGVKAKALLTAIPLQNTAFPLLHGLQLNVNFITKNFNRFVDHMVEDIPMDVLEKRIELEKVQTELGLILDESTVTDTDATETVKDCGKLKKEWANKKKKAVTPEEKELIDCVLAEIARREEAAKSTKKATAQSIKTKRAEVRKAKDSLAAVDTRAVTDKSVRMKMEQEIFEPNGSKRSSYHGGDYEGRDALNFLTKAEEMFTPCETLLKGTSKQKRHVSCTDEMISEMCQATKRLLTYYNAIRLLGRKRNGTATDEDISLMKVLVLKTAELEKSMFAKLTPKHHAKFKHLPEDYEKYRGLGDFAEDWVEQDHQLAKVHEEMTKAIPDRKKAFAMHSRANEQTILVRTSGILEKMIDQTKKTKRKRSETENGEKDSMDEWIAKVAQLPDVHYTLGSVNAIIIKYRRLTLEEIENR